MGTNGSKAQARKVDCSTSNTSLSDLRYIVTEKPKWKVFKKTEIKAVPNRCHEGLVPDKGCNCGKFEPCRQRVTPKGVTIHYPKKTKKNKKPKSIKAVPNRCHEGLVPDKGCNCGKFEPCRQRVTPKGVTIHYPKKTKKNKKPKSLNKKGHSFNFSLNFGSPPATFNK